MLGSNVSALNTHTPIDFCLARCCRGAIAAIGPAVEGEPAAPGAVGGSPIDPADPPFSIRSAHRMAVANPKCYYFAFVEAVVEARPLCQFIPGAKERG
jgi:hypothetical protein